MTPFKHFVGSEATIIAEERHDDDLFEVGNIGNAHAAFAHSSARMARTLHHHHFFIGVHCRAIEMLIFRFDVKISALFLLYLQLFSSNLPSNSSSYSPSVPHFIVDSSSGNAIPNAYSLNPPLNHNDVLLTASVVSEYAAARVFLPFNALSFIATFGRYGFSTNEFPEGSSTMNVKGSSSPAESLSMCWQKASTCSYTSGHVSLRYGCSWRSCSETRLRIPSTVLRSPCCVIGGMSSCNSGMLMVQLSPLMI